MRSPASTGAVKASVLDQDAILIIYGWGVLSKIAPLA